MPFSKRFPRNVGSSVVWEEVVLTEAEEQEIEKRSTEQNIKLMKKCLDDAQSIVQERGMKDFQTNVVSIAIALFEKRASHTVFWKENLAKEKFDKKSDL
jgi:hypothetical protein